MGNIVGEEIPGYTSSQINKRQEIHGKTSGRTPQELTVLNANTSWVKLASGVSVDKDKLKELGLNEDLSGMALARENILFGGTSSKPVQTSSTNSPVSSPKKYSTSPVAGYEHTEDFGIVPMPGIESISIKNLNRGSIKKAKIKIKVHSRSQFEIIDTLYLRLGYTALLEWGNANYISNDTEDQQGEFKTVNTTLVEDPKRFFNINFEKDRSWRDILPSINYFRDKYDGNYDGFLGKISNFSWDFNPDGSYDIDLEMISMGDIIESLKSNVSISTELSDFIKSLNIPQNASGEDEPNPLAPYDNNNLITSMLWVWKYLGKDDTKSTSKGLSIKTGDEKVGFIGRILNPPSNSDEIKIFKLIPVAVFKKTGTFRGGFFEEGEIAPIDNEEPRIIEGDLKDAEDTKVAILKNLNRFGNPAYKWFYRDVLIEESSRVVVYDFLTTTYIPTKSIIRLNTEKQDHYIKFEYLLQYLKEKVIPRIKINNGATNTNDKFTPLFKLDFNTGDGGETDILTGNYMYTLPNQISFDPRVCVVRNDSVYKVGTPDVPARVLPQLPPFRLVDEKSTTKHPNHAYLLNMYLNFDFVVSSLDSNTDDRGDVGLFGFLDTLCKGINKAMGGINNLEPIVDESSNKLKIIDSSLSRGKKRGAYGLEVVGYNPNFNSSTFLRNINLKTAITPEYATMMTIGATAGGYVKGVEATAFSNWNEGLIDRFKTEVVSAQNTQASGSVDVSDGNEAEKNYIENYLRKYTACYGFQGRGNTPNPYSDWTRTGRRAQIKFVDDVISSNISIVTEYYKFLQNKNDKGNAIGFIPFKFSFDMDGLSGFKIYNKLHVSTRFLPRNYGNTLDFIITGVTNDVKSNDWTTSIETMVVPVTRDTNGVEKNITELSEGVLNASSVPVSPSISQFFGSRGFTPGSTYSPSTTIVTDGWSWTQPGTSALGIAKGPVLQGYDLAPHHDSSPSLYLTDPNQKFGFWTRRKNQFATHPGKLMIVGDASANRVENGRRTWTPWIPSPVSGIVTFAGLYRPGSNGQQVSAIHIKSSTTGHTYIFLHGSDIQFNTNDTIRAGDYMFRQSDKGSAGAIHVHYEFPDDKVWLINEWIRKMVTNDPSYNHSTP